MNDKRGATRLLGVTIVCVALLGGCAKNATDEASESSPEVVQGAGAGGSSSYTPKTVRFTEGNDGRTARLYTGDTFTITLEENPSTGHEWEFDSTPSRSVLRTTSDRYIAPEGNPPPGAAGKHLWEFRAANPGNTKVELGYYPPQDGADEVDQFTANVQVSDPPSKESPSHRTVRFTDRNDGATANLVVGDTLIITLNENRSTGQSWQYSKRPSRSVARSTSDRYAKPPSGSQPGRAGRHIFELRATGAGATWVKLELVPADGGEPTGTYQVRIKVVE